ncbi:tetratricopeptide repeat protein [Granulicella cerasi]|uniref:Tetratricopeptide repeat protein n=1 Tax=Granulicella cerasi TaxID=741063 RepID=A0ABW1Z5S9_9BACT|nr:tetratricopeptide repeat protein [Granulicella cerasi]
MTLVRRSALAIWIAVATSAMAQKPAVNPAVKAPDHASSYYHYGLAKVYENQAQQSGRQDYATQAIEQYKMALDADPDSRVLSNGLANLYFNLGRVREAVDAAKAQVARNPDDADAHMLLGRTYLRSLGNGEGQQSQEILNAAISEYETIARLKPDNLETHLLLGQLYGLAHDSAKSEEQFRIAQKLSPGSEEVTLSLARLYSEQGDLKHAAKVIADVPVDDRTPRMNFALGSIYDQLKQPKDAIEAYREVLAEDGDNQDAKKALAQSLLADGQSDEAAKVYAQILKGDRQDPQALIRQAELARQHGKYEEALRLLQKANAQVSNNLELEYNLGLVYDALGNFDESAKQFRKALDDSASADGKYQDSDLVNRAMFLDRLANVYREQGKTSDAVAAYAEMSALGGDYQLRGTDSTVDAYRDAHDWKSALKTAEDAAKAMPTNREAQLTYARQLGDAGKLEEGIKLANAQKTGKPMEDREVAFVVADMQARAKHWKEAIATVDATEPLAKKPEEKAFTYYFRGSILERQKMFDQAEVDFRKGLAIDPNSASIQNDFGFMLAERGVKLDEALTMVKKAVAYDPQNGAYLDSLAWVYYKQGQYALAEQFARKAAQRQPNDPSIMDHLGEIEAKNGKLQAAVHSWEMSVALYATALPPEADPADVAKVQKKLETARVRVAHSGAAKEGGATKE